MDHDQQEHHEPTVTKMNDNFPDDWHRVSQRMLSPFPIAHGERVSPSIDHGDHASPSDNTIQVHGPLELTPEEPVNIPSFVRPEDGTPPEDHLPLPDLSHRFSLTLQQTQQLQKSAHDFLYSHQKLALIRQENLYKRNNIEYLELSHTHQVKHLLASTKELRIKASELTETSAAVSTELKPYEQKVEKDYDTFKAAVEAHRIHDEELSKREAAMKRREEALANSAEAFLNLMKDLSILNANPLDQFVPPGSATDPTSRSHSPALLPAVLADYYDKAGDIGYLNERLEQLDAEYLENRMKRMVREDQELGLDMPNHLFEAGYRSDREAALKELEDAQKAAETAHQACLKAGIDPDRARLSASQEALDDSPADEPSSPSELRDGYGTPLKPLTTQSSISGLQPIALDTSTDPTDSDAKHRKPRRRKERRFTHVHQWFEKTEQAGILTGEDLDSLSDSLDWDIQEKTIRGNWRSVDDLRNFNVNTGELEHIARSEMPGSRQTPTPRVRQSGSTIHRRHATESKGHSPILSSYIITGEMTRAHHFEEFTTSRTEF